MRMKSKKLALHLWLLVTTLSFPIINYFEGVESKTWVHTLRSKGYERFVFFQEFLTDDENCEKDDEL